ncbi:MAG: hypothetical protein LBU66_07530 [Treponema sp.]|jgi:hypothetical protein|nr:hypothetical protein [Treponema sp.]
MKRVVFLLVLIFALTVAVSAQSFTVQEVTGRVEREAGGAWTQVSVGDTLTADAVVRTAIGASFIVRNGTDVASVGALKNGKISELISGSTGIQIQGNVSQTDTGAASRNLSRVSTASARASDAATTAELDE